MANADDADVNRPPALTPGQLQALRALLGQVARVVERYETARGAALKEHLSYLPVEQPLTEAERQRLDPLMLDLVRAANALAQRGAIPPITRNQRATLLAEFMVLWSDAEDTSIHKLAAYGPVSKVAQTVLGPDIARLIRAADALAALQDTEASPPPLK